MADLKLSGALARAVPQGPKPGADPTPITLGLVYAVDATNGQVQARARGSAVWIPAVAARYQVGGTCVIAWDAIAGRPVQVIGTPTPANPVILATVTAASGTTITVTWNGKATPLPGIPSTYTVGQTAWVHTDDWGRPFMVAGPSSVKPPAPAPAPVPPSQGTIVTSTATLAATWSGSWSSSRGKWNAWNVNRYGWPGTLWQGNAYGSGPMVGLATFGSLVTNLGAIQITAARLVAHRSDGEYGSKTLTIQPTAAGSQPSGAPAGTGTTHSGAASQGGTVSIALDAITADALRTGAARGFVTAGSDYSGWTSISLALTYTRRT